MKIDKNRIFWSEETKALTYLFHNSKRKFDIVSLIAEHQATLKIDPTDVSLRSMLAACLEMNGQIDEAVTEWKQVADSKESHWSDLAEAALYKLNSKIDDQ